MNKFYKLRHRVKSVNSVNNKNFVFTYEKWWEDVATYVKENNEEETESAITYKVSFEVGKDLSIIDGFEVVDEGQESKLKISLNDGRLIFNTDADEFILPESYTPEGSETACGFFMCNEGKEIIIFSEINMKNVNTSSVSSMQNMFNGCNFLYSIDFDGVDTSNVENMRAMFSMCSSLEKIKNMNFDTSKVKTMNRMFFRCVFLRSIDLSKFDTSNVEDMDYMFYMCYHLKNIKVSKFDTSKAKNKLGIFDDCAELNKLNYFGIKDDCILIYAKSTKINVSSIKADRSKLISAEYKILKLFTNNDILERDKIVLKHYTEKAIDFLLKDMTNKKMIMEVDNGYALYSFDISKVKNSNITSFKFSLHKKNIAIKKIDDEYIIKYSKWEKEGYFARPNSLNQKHNIKINQSVMDELTDIIINYIPEFRGCYISPMSNCLDGNGWSLDVKFENKQHFSTGGYMAFTKVATTLMNEIVKFINNIAKKSEIIIDDISIKNVKKNN